MAATAVGVAWWLLDQLTVLSDLPPIKDPAAAASARNEIVRTALAAAAGVGAAITLALAFRRQRHTELVAATTEHDATERRVTELYTKAAEQLGNDQAPVRLAGLYALERLAQDTPALRQTIVRVICAYLRMPYTPPREQDKHEKIRTAQRAARAIGTAHRSASSGRDPHEERQVRLTAQRILTDHLRHHPTAAHRWWQPRPPDPNLHHWPDMHLDLTGATLIDLNLSACHISDGVFTGANFSDDARFEEATFSGDARFDQATFSGNAWFARAAFSGEAYFLGAAFSGEVQFDGATFSDEVWFDGVTFSGNAGFHEVTFPYTAGFGGVVFSGNAWFIGVTFSGEAEFDRVTFSGNTWFRRATFSRSAVFDQAAFSGDARFEETAFSGDTRFDQATFSGDARFDQAVFSGDARFRTAIFSGNTWFPGVTFSGNTWFLGVTFSGDTWFDGVTFSGDTWFDGVTFSGDTRFRKATFSGNTGFSGATFSSGARFDGAAGLETAGLHDVRLVPLANSVPREWPPTWRVKACADGWQALHLAVRPDDSQAATGGPTLDVAE